MTKFVAFSCTHFPVHSEEFRQWRLAKIREIRPDVVVNMGDWLDADAASRWPNEHDWTLQQEYDLAAKDARETREAAGPDARLVWLLGNHDANLEAPNRIPKKLRELCSWRQHLEMHEALKDWTIIPYTHRSYWRLGQVTFQHGAQTNVNAERDQAILYGVPRGLYVMGHTHRPIPVSRVILPGKVPVFGLHYCNVGCGADWDRMEYISRSNIALWGRGLLVGDCNTSQRRNNWATRQWDAELLIHSMAL